MRKIAKGIRNIIAVTIFRKFQSNCTQYTNPARFSLLLEARFLDARLSLGWGSAAQT
jgi:hypothetical protein